MILLYDSYDKFSKTPIGILAQANFIAYMEDTRSWYIFKDRLADETGPVRTGNILERVVRHLRAYDKGV